VDAFKFGSNEDRFVASSLIGLYSGNGDIEDTYRVFDEIANKDDHRVCSMQVSP
jgi:hypothetical protein